MLIAMKLPTTTNLSTSDIFNNLQFDFQCDSSRISARNFNLLYTCTCVPNLAVGVANNRIHYNSDFKN